MKKGNDIKSSFNPQNFVFSEEEIIDLSAPIEYNEEEKKPFSEIHKLSEVLQILGEELENEEYGIERDHYKYVTVAEEVTKDVNEDETITYEPMVIGSDDYNSE